MFSQSIMVTLNHLLAESGWALERLARFSGKTLRFNVTPFTFFFLIENDGTLCEAPDEVKANVTLTIPPSLLPRLVLQDEAAVRLIESTGESALIDEIFFLAANLRWDATEDISRITGDIVAERVVQFAKAKHQLVSDVALNVSQALAEYWVEERPLIAKPQQLAFFTREVNKLSDEVNQLGQRIAALSFLEEGNK